jgi:hypothetical protein
MLVHGVRYLRSQAEFCLQLAAQMSDREAAENLRAAATGYLARAAEAEETCGFDPRFAKAAE